MRMVVLTGMSGSGKSTAIRALEDAGYYAIDNLPIVLLDKLVELVSSTVGEVEKVAIVVDARRAQDLKLVPQALERTRAAGHEVDLIFLDAADDLLERRYSETRRRHPLGNDDSVMAGILAERGLLAPLREAASRVLDTGAMSVHELRREIQELAAGGSSVQRLAVTLVSFGFKYGLPGGADLAFDVRFLPNPYFVEGLRAASGEEPEVARYVLDRASARTFLERTYHLLEFLLPEYEHEGKAYLTIAIGCTGGRHRSVAITNEIKGWMVGQGRTVHVRHRDVYR